ncbi:MAG TPA: PD-(D/E)XK nuclease family protein [Bacteroidia bacterium]|jgi:hypothetical protein|nr:PD-(D/E)XK nuclease family protein [Bacteroidia bacterium]
MQSFLGKVSEYLLSVSENDPGNVCVVFPNRRAGLFLKKELAAQIKGPVWSPDILSIEDLIWNVSGLKKTDAGEQLLILYKVYRKHEKEKPESFDVFCKWAPTLLSDLNETDNHLADTKKLFRNLADIKEIEQWSLGAEQLTDFQKQYIHFWDSIGTWYHDYAEELNRNGLAYYGSAARYVSGHAVALVRKQGWKKIIFAGFNALSPAEEKIISALVENGIGEILWDGDRYYFEDKAQEAGKFLRKYRNTLLTRPKNAAFVFENITDELSTGNKNITITAVARNVSQAKAAAQFLSGLNEKSALSEKTAVVLADETLLFPLLHSLPFEGPVNVTMGYPLKNSPAASLLTALFLLQENAARFNVHTREGELKFYHADLTRLFRHPLFSALTGDSRLATVFTELLTRNNSIFCAASVLKKAAEEKNSSFGTAALLFVPWKNTGHAIENLHSIIAACRAGLPLNENGFNMDVEFLFRLDQLLNRAATLNEQYALHDDLKAFRTLMEQQVAGSTIPFSGEPVQGMQVMGFLETRTLDFENVILLSANENILPSSRSNSTFILYELRKHFGLPTFSDRDATFAYHFYHLLQRAKNIFITYNTDTDLFGNKEKSRFITQLLHELPSINKNVKITQQVFDPGLHASSQAQQPISITKDEEVMNAISAYAEKGFSPSSLNNYISCQLKFYLHHIAGIREHDEVEETIGADTLGTIMHKTLELIYTPVLGKKTDAAFYDSAILSAPSVTAKVFNEYFPGEGSGTGKNLLAKKIAVQYVTDLLKKEKKDLENGGSEIIALEKEMKVEMEAAGRKIILKGTADRIEKKNGTLRIIDYKTGIVDEKDLKVKSNEKDNISASTLLVTNNKFAKAFQLLTYALLYKKENASSLPLQSGIISFRKNKSGLMLCEFEKNNVLTDDVLQEFEMVLREVIASVFDTGNQFLQTEDRKVCELCDFRKMCGRE